MTMFYMTLLVKKAASSSCREPLVPSTVLQLAVATSVLRYIRHTKLVRKNLDVYIS